jgi:SSS family solute:Na+ symporter
VLFTAWAFLTSNGYTSGDQKRLFLDLGSWNYTHHEYMLGVYSHLVLFGAGYGASWFFRSGTPHRDLTFYGWLDKRRQAMPAPSSHRPEH